MLSLLLLDGIIVGGSNIDYILHNVEACNKGPLDKGIITLY